MHPTPVILQSHWEVNAIRRQTSVQQAGAKPEGTICTNLERMQEGNPVLCSTKDYNFILNPCLLSSYKDLSCEDTSFPCGDELIFNQELE